MENIIQQGSLEWHRMRLGNFSGSEIANLMVGSRAKIDENASPFRKMCAICNFGETAVSYILKVASKRSMNEKIVNDDFLFGEYLDNTNTENRAMRWGHEQEPNARDLYEKITGYTVEERPFIKCEGFSHLGDSPDGKVCFQTTPNGEIIKLDKEGSVEIKCPSQETFAKYVADVFDNESLKKVNAQYYYQCQMHMLADRTEWCDFIVYCPYQQKPIHIVRILPDSEAQMKILEKYALAELCVMAYEYPDKLDELVERANKIINPQPTNITEEEDKLNKRKSKKA